MAKFIKAYRKLEVFEGVYSNNPVDPGGETFKGISRKFWPKWEGWPIIDFFKRNNKEGISFDSLLRNSYLLKLTEDFYKNNFWDVFKLDDISDQDIANELFESSVNLGIVSTTKLLQKSLNLLNRNATLYSDIEIDGVYGKNTKNALLACLNNKDGVYLFNMLNILQGQKYLTIGNETFIRGWLNRIKIKKR